MHHLPEDLNRQPASIAAFVLAREVVESAKSPRPPLTSTPEPQFEWRIEQCRMAKLCWSTRVRARRRSAGARGVSPARSRGAGMQGKSNPLCSATAQRPSSMVSLCNASARVRSREIEGMSLWLVPLTSLERPRARLEVEGRSKMA
jgi:hypothetical protein